jgi:alpha-glucosidase
MRKLVILLCVFAFEFLHSQVTLRITSIPANTPTNAVIYVAGSFNTWNPSNQAYIMQPDGLGTWQITIPEATGTVEYKFTRGSWTTVEGNALGAYLPNRTFTFSGSPQVINLTILSWEDLSGSAGTSTAASNVQILSNSFFIPQLNRYRKIWIYLPPDYQTTTKTYPVLYMQDGQNLFDNLTSYAGEWHIDETLNTLHAQGNYGAIVVGIENGGTERLNEYSPWVNSQYGGGQGAAYMQFIAETLKPFIDANFRTKPQSQFNALIGSSMGAFISTYGGVEYPQLFSKIGAFSPAFWFAQTELNAYINITTHPLNNFRIYFVAGTNEWATVVTDAEQIKTTLESKGVLPSNVYTKFDSYGTHSENYWSGEFAAAYQWLFQNESLNLSDNSLLKPIIYKLASDSFFVSGLDHEIAADIFSVLGMKVGSLKLINGINPIELSLPKGVYILKNNDLQLKFTN